MRRAKRERLSKPFTESHEKTPECKTSLGFVARSQLDSSHAIYTLKLLFVLCLNGKLKFDKVIWTNPDLMQSNWCRAVSTAHFPVHWEFDIVRKSPCDSFHFKLQTNCPFWVSSLFLWLLFKCLPGKFFFSIWRTLFQAFCFYPSLLALWQICILFYFILFIRHIWETASCGDLLNFLFSTLHSFLGCLLKFLPYTLAVIFHIFIPSFWMVAKICSCFLLNIVKIHHLIYQKEG